ncbi:methylmalonyl-CoA mutase metallochaperone MeaB [Alteribacillus persepolensis]|uniref:Methylmalonyl-CoA mutase metallochaperone MeaB n=1 Tax=Alteribacillus persepolensis TaxID=568899 RepID=A0A1G8K2H0_9BACI|nr:methylmalonyl Co-A mutase-associated GTPase MeaB [Alteribacillus persepolensis]SDI37567.1 methylmalonyl-CoA mutase metallochaperone MeaB [Alteribacillus persepolensis]
MEKQQKPRPKRRRTLSVEEYVQGVLSRDRAVMSRAITLIESNAPKHFDKAQEVLKRLMPYTGKALRAGISGVPGAGKSTLIERFGTMLCEKGHQLAVLAVDPSSSVSKGSILGDKTRMETLSKHPNAYVRPSPSGGALGGVARKSRETMLICEAAGYDVIFVETVGVGQSEWTVRSMVDFFLVLMLTGGGDELQGMKKGIMEMADAIYINKADGNNKQKARNTRAEYRRLLHFLQPATPGWKTKVDTISALTGEGMDELWDVMTEYEANMKASGILEKRRKDQLAEWMETLIEDELKRSFYENDDVKQQLPVLKNDVTAGNRPLAQAVKQLMEAYQQK